MSDDTWTPPGPGVNNEDKKAIIAGGRRKKPERSDRSGSSRSLTRNQKLYREWGMAIEPVTYGKATVTTVPAPRFNAQVGRIKDQLVPGERTAAQEDALDRTLVDAFKKFAVAISVGHVNVEGKPAFGVFTSRWASYTASTAPPPSRKPGGIRDTARFRL